MRFLIWRFGEFGKDRQINIARATMALRIQIAKLKFPQYLRRANSPNLMLSKLPAKPEEVGHDFRGMRI